MIQPINAINAEVSRDRRTGRDQLDLWPTQKFILDGLGKLEEFCLQKLFSNEFFWN